MAYKKITTEEYKERIKTKYNGLYEMLDEYQGTYKPIRFKCFKHDFIFIRTPKQMNDGISCPKCSKERNEKRYKLLTKTTEDFIREATIVHNGYFIYDKNTVYVNGDTDVIITCPIHGQFKQNPRYHLRGGGCKKCNFPVTSLETFIAEGNRVHKGKYIYTESEYIDSRTKIKIICPEHGEFWQLPPEHIRGYGCPKCNQSKLELYVKDFLEKNKIKFQEQLHDFNLSKQSLDFYLQDYKIGIECQGIQHFKNHFYFFKNEETFKAAIDRDIRKFNKCKEQGIKILYYVKQEYLPKDYETNPLFGGIYTKDNTFTDLESLKDAIMK